MQFELKLHKLLKIVTILVIATAYTQAEEPPTAPYQEPAPKMQKKQNPWTGVMVILDEKEKTATSIPEQNIFQKEGDNNPLKIKEAKFRSGHKPESIENLAGKYPKKILIWKEKTPPSKTEIDQILKENPNAIIVKNNKK